MSHVPSPRSPILRTLGLTVGALVGPAVLFATYPLLGIIVTVLEIAVPLTLLGLAVMGTEVHSERAFRLLRMLAGRPEPPAPGGRRRTELR